MRDLGILGAFLVDYIDELGRSDALVENREGRMIAKVFQQCLANTGRLRSLFILIFNEV